MVRPTFPTHTRDLSSIAKTNPVFRTHLPAIRSASGTPFSKRHDFRRKVHNFRAKLPLVLPERAQENLHTTDFLCFFGKINTEETAASKNMRTLAYRSVSCDKSRVTGLRSPLLDCEQRPADTAHSAAHCARCFRAHSRKATTPIDKHAKPLAIMTYQWNYVPAPPGEEAEGRRLAEELGMHPVFGRMLRERCIYTAAAARRFFRPQLTDLHDPFLMNDMQVAVERLNLAIARKERIMVYGDYDVDGVTSVALVYRFISRYYSNIDYYIPDRYEEGYGVSKRGIDYAAETGVRLIIVLDCGIKAVEEITYAKECGIDFIICDHHVPDESCPRLWPFSTPSAATITTPYTHLSGCGVGFKFMQAFAADNGIEFNRLHELLDLCAVSIASDIVPVTGENRILAYHACGASTPTPPLVCKPSWKCADWPTANLR